MQDPGKNPQAIEDLAYDLAERFVYGLHYHRVGPGVWTQIVRPGLKHLYPVSPLTSPKCIIDQSNRLKGEGRDSLDLSTPVPNNRGQTLRKGYVDPT